MAHLDLPHDCPVAFLSRDGIPPNIRAEEPPKRGGSRIRRKKRSARRGQRCVAGALSTKGISTRSVKPA
jgi:hypothetical protein